MKTFIVFTLLALPLFVRSQSSLIGTWKGHYPSIITRVKGDTQKYSLSADSISVTFVFRKNLTGYIQTIDYTNGAKKTSLANFKYRVINDNCISMTFLKPSRQSPIKKRKFLLRGDTLYFIPTKKEAEAEFIDLMYEMKYKRIN